MDNTTLAPLTVAALARPRSVERVITGTPTSDGAGVKLVRVLTQDLQRRLDPFLMLDNFATDDANDYIAGFPDHPHRGFETVTYMVEGRMRHRDSAGHEGLVQNGGIQWMTAGRGLVHSEMPEQEHGRMEGFQLWLNLPAKDKLRAPWYRDFQAAEIPQVAGPGMRVRVIAGRVAGADGIVAGAVQREVTEPLFLDLLLEPGAGFGQPLPERHNAFVYVYRGSVAIRGREVPSRRMALLANERGSDGVVVQAGADGARAILLAGCPLNEPIVQYGPFVMNTREQILQAFDDYQRGAMS